MPGRPLGGAWNDRGTYWMRAGDSLVPMPDDQLRRIHAEIEPDFSAEPCAGATLAHLNPVALAEYRSRWARQARNPRIETWSNEEMLRNAELASGGVPTNTALLLFGTREALTRFIPQMETVEGQRRWAKWYATPPAG